jgi:hypothetical protein
MDLRSQLENAIESLRRNDNKFKVPTDKLILMAANYSPKGANEIRYNYYDEFRQEVIRLLNMNIISPIGKARADVLSYTDFWILPKGHIEYDTELYTHMLNQYTYFDMSYYRLKYKEFKEDKIVIDALYEYYTKKDKEKLTSNELGFLLFKDEKAFEQKEEKSSTVERPSIGFALTVLNRVGITLENLNAYATIYPFYFYARDSFYKKDKKNILIIENKDTFFTMAWDKDRWNEFDMFIFGEGFKIHNSFSLAEQYGIMPTDEIVYFGDIDLVGLYIYALLKKRYVNYKFKLFTSIYEKLINKYSIEELGTVRKNHEFVSMDLISEIMKEEFSSESQKKIIELLLNKKYIPQEAIRFCNVSEE